MPSSRALALIAITLLSREASAQSYKDNSSPPIDVPTAPVPQGPPPPAPPPAAKPPPPKPAAPAPTAAPAPKPEEKKEATPKPEGATDQPKYNNEGVFKISGSKGSGYVGGDKGAKTKPAPGKTGKAKPVSTVNVAQWPGFRMLEDGGSEVMVEFSQNPTPPTEHKSAGSVTYVFKGAHVIKHNNQNPLLTIHFNTPVASARLSPKKGELHLEIHFRAGADATPSSGMRASSDGDGQQFFVKFGAGNFLPRGADNDAMPEAPTQKLKNKPEKSDTPPPTKPKSDTGAKTGPSP